MSFSNSRRKFLKTSLQSTGYLLVPSFLAACSNHKQLITELPHTQNPFMAWFGIDENNIRQLMTELTRNGADNADIYFQHTRSNRTYLEENVISRATSKIDQGVGFRVIVGTQTGYAFTEDLTMESMLGAARTAASIANGKQIVNPVAYHNKKQGNFYNVAMPWTDVSINEKINLLKKVNEYTINDPIIKKTNILLLDQDERVLIATADGNIVTDRRPMSRLMCSLTMEKNGETQTNSHNIAGRQDLTWFTDDKIKTLVDTAKERTAILFEATQPPAGDMPVILSSGASGILLHEAIGHGMEADFNRKGTSIYSEMLNKKVAENFVTIVDDGMVEKARGALNYDDEGNESEHTVLVKDGILASYMHDNLNASLYKMKKSTGSGRRQSFRYAPLPRMRCTTMENGPHTRDEIIASVKRGVISETYSNGQVDIGGGDFTFYVKNGWLVEDGKITAPVKDFNIIGNGPEILTKVSMVANDSHMDIGGWNCGKQGQTVPVSLGMPTVLVSNMTVGGKNV